MGCLFLAKEVASRIQIWLLPAKIEFQTINERGQQDGSGGKDSLLDDLTLIYVHYEAQAVLELTQTGLELVTPAPASQITGMCCHSWSPPHRYSGSRAGKWRLYLEFTWGC